MRHVATQEYVSPRPGQELLTVAELARRLRIARTTVYRLPIPYVIVGSRRRYRADDVERYLERGSP
jgi:excisionase family DNA binding protein